MVLLYLAGAITQDVLVIIAVQIALVLASYLIGSVPSGYLLARAFKGIDIRRHGSHNVGAINVFRVGGPIVGILTLVADITARAFCLLLPHGY